MGHTIIVGLKHNTAVSNANGVHWFCWQTSITGRSANKHMLVLNVSDPFFRERIMSHGHHFPHQNVTTILEWWMARKALMFSGAFPSVREKVGKWPKDACLRKDGHDEAVWIFFNHSFCESKKYKLCQPTESYRAIARPPQLMDSNVCWKASDTRPSSSLGMRKNPCKEGVPPNVCRDWQTCAQIYSEFQLNGKKQTKLYSIMCTDWLIWQWIECILLGLLLHRCIFFFWKQEWPQTWLLRNFEQVPIQAVPSFLPNYRPVFYCVDITECKMLRTERMLNKH